MQYHSNINPNSDSLYLKDQIFEKLHKAKAVLTCIMFAAEFVRGETEIDNHTLYHALWAVDEYLEQLVKLYDLAGS